MGNINKIFNTEVFFSDGNSKMGAVASVSLPPVESCINCKECSKKCYAKRMYNRLPIVKKQYDSNLELLHNDRKKYFEDIGTVLKYTRFFRWHVSGDIVDYDYFANMVRLAKENTDCVQLAFTKNYDVVNNYLASDQEIPENLHILFSVWKDTPYNNTYNIPECHIKYKDGETTAGSEYKECDGNCFMCFFDCKGCIGLKSGEKIVINEH